MGVPKPELHTGVWSAGLGLLGAGAVIVWPNQLWVGYALFVIAGLLFAWGLKADGEHWWKRDRIGVTWPYVLMLLSVIGLATGAFFAIRAPKPSPSQAAALTPPDPHPKVKGISITAVIYLSDHDDTKRHYLLSAKNDAGAVAQIFLSKSNRLVFAVTDTSGEEYPLEVSASSRGVPIGEKVTISAEAAILAKTTDMRIAVNGNWIAERTLPFRLNLRDYNWKPLSLGGHHDGHSFTTLRLYWLGVRGATFSSAEYRLFIESLKREGHLDD